ncbi:MAG: VPLPA-CTERM sorting domain-containing protein, partial [Amphiplicatus sp.]
LTAAATAALLAFSGTAHAGVVSYVANLVDINNLGASGVATLDYDDMANTLAVNIQASGLPENMIHVQHIHGLVDGMGNAAESNTPTIAQDMAGDNDGVIELGEGATVYGPILLSLSDPAGLDPLGSEGGFPLAPGGVIDFSFTYDLNDPTIFAGAFGVDQLLPLVMREIVIHGGFLAQGQGANGGEADGTGGFKATLPVLAGEIEAIPLPGAAALLLTGLAGFPFMRRRNKDRAAKTVSAS